MVAAMLLGLTATAWTPPAGSEASWVTPAVSAPGLTYATFEGEAAGGPVSYHIYTPAAYEAEPDRRFPVLYWLHGSGGGLLGLRPVAAHFDAGIAAGKIDPMIVVFPNGMGLSMWVDSKDGTVPMETVVVDELVPHIDATYRTIATREGRLIEGFSMGGYGAARLGLKHHDLFAGWSSLAGGPLQESFTYSPRVGDRERRWVLETVFGGDQEYYRAVSPWVLAEENAEAVRDRSRIRVAIGDEDEMLEPTKLFDARLSDLGIPHTFIVLPGIGHENRAFLDALSNTSWEFYRSPWADPE